MSENKKITNITDYLDSLTPQQKGMIEKLRGLVQKTVPEVEEKIMWSLPWYKLHGKPFVVLMHASKHMSIGFMKGTDLHSEMLEGTGKNMRHVKIKLDSDIPEKELTRLLKEAEKLQI